MNLRLSTVNAEIQRQGFDAELVKGEGYFYFLGPDVERAYSTMVNVTRLNQISLDQWMIRFHEIARCSSVW